MINRRNSVRTLLLLLAAGFILWSESCSSLFTTKVKDILDNPRKYEGQEVVVQGQAKDSINLIVKAFHLEDGTGKILVITEKAVPKTGETVRVKGTVQQGFSFGSKSSIVIMEKK